MYRQYTVILCFIVSLFHIIEGAVTRDLWLQYYEHLYVALVCGEFTVLLENAAAHVQ